MNFLISANTDIGTLKKTNQDSVLIKKIHTCQGEMVFAVLCDGMGGLEKGEVDLSGNIDSIAYSDVHAEQKQGENLFARLFR